MWADIRRFLPCLGEMLWHTVWKWGDQVGFAQRLLHSVNLPISEGKGSAGDVSGEQFSSEPRRVPGFKPSKSHHQPSWLYPFSSKVLAGTFLTCWEKKVFLLSTGQRIWWRKFWEKAPSASRVKGKLLSELLRADASLRSLGSTAGLWASGSTEASCMLLLCSLFLIPDVWCGRREWGLKGTVPSTSRPHFSTLNWSQSARSRAKHGRRLRAVALKSRTPLSPQLSAPLLLLGLKVHFSESFWERQCLCPLTGELVALFLHSL